MENKFTLHNPIVLTIFVPKISKLVKIYQSYEKSNFECFLTRCKIVIVMTMVLNNSDRICVVTIRVEHDFRLFASEAEGQKVDTRSVFLYQHFSSPDNKFQPEAIRDLKPSFKIVLSPGEHNGVSVFALVEFLDKKF